MGEMYLPDYYMFWSTVVVYMLLCSYVLLFGVVYEVWAIQDFECVDSLGIDYGSGVLMVGIVEVS